MTLRHQIAAWLDPVCHDPDLTVLLEQMNAAAESAERLADKLEGSVQVEQLRGELDEQNRLLAVLGRRYGYLTDNQARTMVGIPPSDLVGIPGRPLRLPRSDQ